jgi:hypothetical protein
MFWGEIKVKARCMHGPWHGSSACSLQAPQFLRLNRQGGRQALVQVQSTRYCRHGLTA